MRKGSHQSYVIRIITLLCGFLITSLPILAQSTAFTYQGKLSDSGSPANGSYDFQFKLFDTVTVGTGTQQGTTVTLTNVAVANGIFTVQIDFGACASCFNGAARFLDISVRAAGGGVFTTLSPRQQITGTPYAIRSSSAAAADTATTAASATTATNATQLGGVAASQYVLTSDSRLSDARPPTPGSANYIQNTTTAQTANFNLIGNGTLSGTLSSNVVSTSTSIQAPIYYDSDNTGYYLNPASRSNTNVLRFNLTDCVNGYCPPNNAIRMTPNFHLNSATGYAVIANWDNGSVVGNTKQFRVGNGQGQDSFYVTASGDSTAGGTLSANAVNAATQVGIGTTAPAAPLHVVQGASGGTANAEAVAALERNGNAYLQLLTPNASESGVLLGNVSSSVAGGVIYNNFATVNGLQFRTNGNATRMAIDASGNVGIGTTAPAAKLHVQGVSPVRILGDTTTLSASEAVDFFARSSSYGIDLGGMRIQRQASGDIDTILFAAASGNSAAEVMRVRGNGKVGIGTTNPGAKLHVEGGSGPGVYGISINNAGVYGSSTNSAGVYGSSTIGYGVYGSSTNSNGVFGSSSSGDGVYGTSASGWAGYFNGSVNVTGTLAVGTLGSAGATTLCRNAYNQIASCSSSLRFKTDVRPFADGLDLINRLRPISFTWKQGGMHDLGLAAEEVEKVEPLLVTYNAKGEVEGVKYDRINVALVNAVKELAAENDALKQKLNEQQTTATAQQRQIRQQQQEIAAIKKLLCQSNPQADLCKATAK